MKNFRMTADLTAISLVLVLSGCNSLSPEAREEREEDRKIVESHIRASHMNPPPQSFQDFGLVRKYITEESNARHKSVGVAVGAYQGGTAIFSENGMAFWVKENKAYVVNEKAKAAAPELPQAPEGIEFNSAFRKAAMENK